MELETFSRSVSDHLTAAAALGDDRTREIAAALAASAGSAVRMAILDALSAATVEVTDALHTAVGADQPTPAVTLHLSGEDVRFTVTVPPSETAPADQPRPDDGDASARITLRLTETLKADIERAAGQSGTSVNSWLVRAATSALQPRTVNTNWKPAGGHRVTGWVTG